MHRQTNRYRSGGDPREICNHLDPGENAGVSQFLGALARLTQGAV